MLRVVKNLNLDPRGALWRRWDLHFHTPSSFDYKDNSVTNEEIVEGLVAAGVRVVAITDHHFIDVHRIKRLQQLGEGRLTVLPGIELRSELGGSKSVHYIGIFSQDCDIETIWTKLQHLNITPAEVRAKGDDKVFVEFKNGCDLIRDLGGIITVHAGSKDNSFESIGNAEAFKQAYKADRLDYSVDALEIGDPNDRDAYRRIVFPYLRKRLPLLLCSDNHNLKTYEVKAPMWIKADPNFAGLLQLINEPEDRIFLGDEPPQRNYINSNGTKYIDSVRFSRTEHAKDDEKWFSGEVLLNHGLVAIIGNKGSGKSALADIIALLGNTRQSDYFGFLNDKRFLELRKRLGQQFGATLTWRNQHEVTKRLDTPADHAEPETVKYIPQNFLESICTDPKNSGFQNELYDVIFSHVEYSQRLGQASLDELVNHLTKATEQRIAQLQEELSIQNGDVISLYGQIAPSFKQRIQADLNQKKLELEALDNAKPTEVPAPSQDKNALETTNSVSANLDRLRADLVRLEGSLEQSRQRLDKSRRLAASCKRVLGGLENLERQFHNFKDDLWNDLELLGLTFEEITSLKINYEKVNECERDALTQISEVMEHFNLDVATSTASEIAARKLEIESQKLLLDEPNRKHQQYLTLLQEWQAKRNDLIGSTDIPGSISQLEGSLSDLELIPDKLAKRIVSRDAITKEIFAAKELLLQEYANLYAPVQDAINAHPILSKNDNLQVKAISHMQSFSDRFLAFIHHGKTGSFYGEDLGRRRLDRLIRESSFDTADDMLQFAKVVEDHLHRDHREAVLRSVDANNQLRGIHTMKDVLDFLYGLSYLQPSFELRWQDKKLDQLSPGERGNLLLVFYLLIDKRDTPLVIDQPEENLDNQTVAGILVPALKLAKIRRQIIMVTHNPNLAVVCDADQIIHSSVNKTNGNEVKYVSGAIENPVLTQLLLDVLEGTKPAFEKRDSKYSILGR